MSQVLAMAARLQEAENTIAELRQTLDRRSSLGPEDTAQTERSSSQATPYPRPIPARPFSPEEMRSDLSLDEKGQVSAPSNSSMSC